MKTGTSSFVACVVLVSSGCATSQPHVQLPTAPSAQAPYEARAAYFKKYSADKFNGYALQLHGGERLYYPEDLIPAVEPDSATAVAAKRAAEARAHIEERRPYIEMPYYAGLGLGTAMMVGGLGGLALQDSNRDLSNGIVMGGLVGGSSLAFLGLGWGMAGALINAADEATLGEAAQTAVSTYPQGLSDRVAIQPNADGLLMDLNQAPPPQAANAKAQNL